MIYEDWMDFFIQGDPWIQVENGCEFKRIFQKKKKKRSCSKSPWHFFCGRARDAAATGEVDVVIVSSISVAQPICGIKRFGLLINYIKGLLYSFALRNCFLRGEQKPTCVSHIRNPSQLKKKNHQNPVEFFMPLSN